LLEEAEFQRWLEQRARDAIGRATELTDDRRRQLDKDTNDSIAIGEFAYGELLSVKALSTLERQGAVLCIVCREQGMTEKAARKLLDKRRREVIAELSSKAVSDPLLVRAILGSLGLPENFLSFLSPTRPSTTDSTTSADSAGTKSSSSSTSSEEST